MSFLEGMLGGFIDKEQATKDTIQEALLNVSEELKCKYNELFLMIQPGDAEMNFKVFIHRIVDGKPTRVREITIKEIVSPEDEHT